MSMKIVIRGEPLAKQSFKITKKGFKYTDKKVTEWRAQARAQIVQQLPKRFEPITTAIKVFDLTFVFPIPKSFPKYKLRHMEEGTIYYKKTKPDIDNLIKNLMDACEGILFINDSQIVFYESVCKRYGKTPRTEFWLR